MNFFKYTAIKIQQKFVGFEPIEPKVVNNHSLHPIFLLGAPRSGTTFLYQLLAKYYIVAYCSNLMALVPSKMSLICQLTQNGILNYNQIKKSDYGYIHGINSPNEAGAIMKLWFSKRLSLQQTAAVRSTVNRITTTIRAPFLIKNLNNSLRLNNILRIFPEARFIHLKRNPEDNARSLIQARRAINKDPGKWWSVAPEGFENLLKRSPEDQVNWQIHQINDILNTKLDHRLNKCITVGYEQLCAHPKDTLMAIAHRFRLRPAGIELTPEDIK